jgi:hypothetical protein
VPRRSGLECRAGKFLQVGFSTDGGSHPLQPAAFDPKRT